MTGARYARTKRIADDRLHPPPHPAHDPDPVRDHAGLLRRRAVRAGRAGRAGDRAALRRRYRRDLAHLGRAGGDFGARGAGAAAAPTARQLEISRRAGPRSGIHQEPGEAVRLRQAGLRALLPDAVELCPLRFRQELFPRHQRAPADQGEAAGLDLARPLDDAAHLPDLDPARHPQGGQGRLALRRLDLGRHHRRLRDPGLPVRDPADHPVRRRLVLRHLPAARADLRQLGAAALVRRRSSTISGTSCCRSSRWRSPPSPP